MMDSGLIMLAEVTAENASIFDLWEVLKSIVNVLTLGGVSLIKTISDDLGDMLGEFPDLIDGLGGLTGVAQKIIDWIKDLPANINSFFDGIFNFGQNIFLFVSHLIGSIVTVIGLAVQAVYMPVNLTPYVFTIFGGAMVAVVAFGVIKMILGR